MSKITRKELRAIIAETVQLAEAAENLPKANQRRVTSTAGGLEPAPDGRFSATIMAKGDSGAEVEVDGDTTVSSDHKEKLAKSLRIDALMGFRSGDLDKDKTYKYVAVFT